MNELNEWYENITYEQAKRILQANMNTLKMSFIAAGYYLKYIRDHELYLEDGYQSIWEFAEDNYGIKKSTASSWMTMNDRFSQGGNSPVLSEEYRGFEKSQLQEMLYLDDKQIQAVAPDMTVKEIREVRKPEKPAEEDQKECIEAVATSQRKEPDPAPDTDPPEEIPESEPEVITEENIEVVEAEEGSAEELYEETSDQSDIDILKEELDKAKNNLNLMRSCYTENDIRVRKQKLIVGALAGTLCDLEEVDIPEPRQKELPELPAMRNNDQRKEFLSKYQAWPVWFEVPQASEVYHRFELPDGSSIVICEYHMWLSWKEKYSNEDPHTTGTREYLLTPGYHYLEDCKTNTTTLIEHLKNVQRKGN